MGRVMHEAIIVTSYDEKRIKDAHQKAFDLGLPITDIIVGWVNCYYTFLIGPDGSKEGWGDAAEGTKTRAEWRKWAEEQAFGDGSSPLEWVEASYGECGCGEYSAKVDHHGFSKVCTVDK